MKPWQQNIISKNKSILIQEIQLNDLVLAEFQGFKNLSLVEDQTLKQLRQYGSMVEATSKFLDLLVTRDKTNQGDDVFDALIQVLKTHSQDQPAVLLENEKLRYLEEPKAIVQDGCTIRCFRPPKTHQLDWKEKLKRDYAIVRRQKLQICFDKPSRGAKKQLLGNDCYKLTPGRPGAALLINIWNFPNYQLMGNGKIRTLKPQQLGSGEDEVYQYSLLGDLGYTFYGQDKIRQKNGYWTRDDVLNIIAEFRDFCNQTKPDSIVVFPGSHGEDNAVITCDTPRIQDSSSDSQNAVHQKLRIKEEVLIEFYESTCPGLQGRPKIFLVNACQIFPPAKTDAIKDLGSPAGDIFVHYAQVPGFSSFRDEGLGSWFVHCFTFVVMKCAKDKHFEEMMNLVAEILKDRKHVNGEFEYGQACARYVLGSTKLLYFPVPS